jgi:hypothetical protein
MESRKSICSLLNQRNQLKSFIPKKKKKLISKIIYDCLLILNFRKCLRKVSSCKSIKYSTRLNFTRKDYVNKELNEFEIKDMNYEKDPDNKVVNIETLDYIPMCKIFFIIFVSNCILKI